MSQGESPVDPHKHTRSKNLQRVLSCMSLCVNLKKQACKSPVGGLPASARCLPVCE